MFEAIRPECHNEPHVLHRSRKLKEKRKVGSIMSIVNDEERWLAAKFLQTFLCNFCRARQKANRYRLVRRLVALDCFLQNARLARTTRSHQKNNTGAFIFKVLVELSESFLATNQLP